MPRYERGREFFVPTHSPRPPHGQRPVRRDPGSRRLDGTPGSQQNFQYMNFKRLEGASDQLMLGVDNVKAGVSGRESLNSTPEPRCDLLVTDVFDVRKSVRAKDRRDTGRFETSGQTFPYFFKLFDPSPFQLP